MAVWALDVCDDTGSRLCGLPTAAGKRFAFKRNFYGEATHSISHADAAATTLIEYLNFGGWPQLKAYRDGVLRFRGHLAPFTEDLDESTTLNLVWRGPFARFLGDGSGRGRFTSEYEAYTDDAGLIAKALIDATNADGDTGLSVSAGDIEATKQRERVYEHANIGEAIVDLSEMFDGFDFEEVYVDEGAALAEFHVYRRMGQDRPSAKCEYGPGTMANCRPVSRETQPPANHVTVLGANGVPVTVSDQASIDRYGLWPIHVSANDVDEDPILEDIAQAHIRPAPIRTISFIPELGMPNCPRPWDDFWLGDTIRFSGRRDAFSENVQARVNEIVLLVDESGNEAAEIPDPMTPDEEAVLRSGLTIEVDTYYNQ